MQYLPNNWSVGDLQRFNAFLDALSAYQALDYVRGKVGASLPQAMSNFLQARQQDLGQLVKDMAQAFMDGWGT